MKNNIKATDFYLRMQVLGACLVLAAVYSLLPVT